MALKTMLAVLGIAGFAAPLAHGQTYQQLAAFQGAHSGAYPEASLLAVGATLFGTTFGGGSAACASGCGTVFSFNPTSHAIGILRAFNGKAAAYPAAGLIAVGNKLYGTTFGREGSGATGGTIFAINPATGATSIVDALQSPANAGPDSSLVDVGDALYGTTLDGGKSAGTVYAFSLKTRTSPFTTIFQAPPDGSSPRGALKNVSGRLYGLAYGGGAGGDGTIYSIDPTSGVERTVYSFTGPNDGSGPIGNLFYADGLLYGVTEYGGQYNYGTVFSFKLSTGQETVLYAFKGDSDGALPSAGVTVMDNTLYGTTHDGGASGFGTVFALDMTTRTKTVLHAFTGGSDGAQPAAQLTNVGGTLYGTTTYGGDATNCPGNKGFFVGCGTIYSLTP